MHTKIKLVIEVAYLLIISFVVFCLGTALTAVVFVVASSVPWWLLVMGTLSVALYALYIFRNSE